MRLLAVASALLVATCVACSGAHPSSDGSNAQDPALSSPSASAQPSTPPGAPPSSPPAPTTSDDGGKGDGADGGGGGGDGGGGGGDGGGGGAGSLCVAGSVAAADPNDTKATATALPAGSSSACGKLTATTDVDYFSFLLPASATNIAFATSYTQQGVDFELSVGAESFKISQPAIFKPGQTYFVKVSTAAKAPVDYRLTITIK